MTIDAILLGNRRHAVVVLSGTAGPGSEAELADGLRVCGRCHTVVDVRQVDGVTPELSKALLGALGRAIDRGRTLSVVVRDEHQRRALRAHGVGTMVPVHDSVTDAVAAAGSSAVVTGPRRR